MREGRLGDEADAWAEKKSGMERKSSGLMCLESVASGMAVVAPLGVGRVRSQCVHSGSELAQDV